MYNSTEKIRIDRFEYPILRSCLDSTRVLSSYYLNYLLTLPQFSPPVYTTELLPYIIPPSKPKIEERYEDRTINKQ
jgi:hypothetical protein